MNFGTELSNHNNFVCGVLILKRTIVELAIPGYEAANSGSLRCALPSIGRNNRLLPACSPLLPQAPSVLPLKQPYSLSRTETAISNP